MPGGVGSACVMHGEWLGTDQAPVLVRLDQHGVRSEERVGRDARLGRSGHHGFGASAPSLGQAPYSEESDVDSTLRTTTQLFWGISRSNSESNSK